MFISNPKIWFEHESKSNYRASLPYQLTDKGVITKNIFSIFLSGYKGESKFIFGGVPEQFKKEPI